MTKSAVRVEGLKEVKDALRELPNSTAKNIMRRILLKRAEPIAEAARKFAPVDEGHLRASIGVSTKLTRRQRKKHKKPDKDDVEVYVGPGTDPAAHLQEFGTVDAPAQPFMRPAWDQEKGKLLDNIAADLWVEIKKAVARIAKKKAKGKK